MQEGMDSLVRTDSLHLGHGRRGAPAAFLRYGRREIINFLKRRSLNAVLGRADWSAVGDPRYSTFLVP